MSRLMDNPILDSDSYKFGHPWMYPKDTTSMFAYFESRVKSKYDNMMLIGLQYILQEHMTTPILHDHVDEAHEFFSKHGEPFHYDGWTHIVNEHQGKLPLRIRAVPEGLSIPTGNIMMSVESLCKHTPWLVGWIETALVRVWGASTVATRGREAKKLLYRYLYDTCDQPSKAIASALHCFGSRGVGAREVAALHGAGHLVNFMGSDTVMAVALIMDHYGTVEDVLPGYSIPATEHSNIISYGPLGELEAFSEFLNTFGDDYPLIACVSDTYDIQHAITEYWGVQLRTKIAAMNAKLLIRLDSGDPVEGVRNALGWLKHAFGTKLNLHGYQTFDHVGIVQGEAVTMESMPYLLDVVKSSGFSTEVIGLGSGGGQLQQINRDTLDVAYKLSSLTLSGVIERGVKKNPKSDPSKASKSGRLDLTYDEKLDEYHTVVLPWGKESMGGLSAMNTVYENGEMVLTYLWDDVRSNAAIDVTIRI